MDIQLPITRETARSLAAGTRVSLSGTLFTARDAAHKRLFSMLEAGERLPVDLENACIYYTGPCPAAPGEIIGPCGPTTASRMDAYTPRFLELGLTAMIGKGPRSPERRRDADSGLRARMPRRGVRGPWPRGHLRADRRKPPADRGYRRGGGKFV